MSQGKAYPPEVVALALERYRDLGSSIKAAQSLALELDDAPQHPVIRQWAATELDLQQILSTERKHRLANRWYKVSNALLDNVERGVDNFTPQQSVVPAAIGTDKYHKLVTEERHSEPSQRNTFIIFEQPQPTEPRDATPTFDATVQDAD